MTATLYLPESGDEESAGVGYHLRWSGGSGEDGAEEFDGPFEMLLRMVREGKADPLRIEIGAITRQYLDALEVLEILDLRVGSEFLKVATMLLRIKAKRLLPDPPAPGAGPVEDTPEALEARLRDYARYRAAARRLRRSLETRGAVFVREPSLPGAAAGSNGSGYAAEELLQVDLFAVVEAFRRVVARARSRPATPLPKPRISMALLIRRIEAAVPAGAVRDFEETLFEVIEGNADRATLVAAFLAVLELARRRRISVRQERDFGPIRIEGLTPD